MLAHAIDNPAPSTIVLISGDRDFAYALSILRLRRYRVVLIALSNAHQSLRAQASISFDWVSDILEPVHPTPSHQPTSPRRGKTSSPPTHDPFYSDFMGHSLSGSLFQESYNQKFASTLELMNAFQDETRCNSKEFSRTPSKHDAKHNSLPPYVDRQISASSVASDALSNGPEAPARVIHSPVPSCHTYINGSTQTPLTTTACSSESNSPRITPTSNTSVASTPKMATYENIMPSRSSAHSALQESAANAPDIAEVPSVMEPMTIEHTIQMLRAKTKLRESSQQGSHAPSDATRSLSSKVADDDNHLPVGSPPAHSNVSLPANVAATPTAPSSPSLIPPSSSLSSASLPSAITQISANPRRSAPSIAVPDKFKILIKCLKSHRSRGIITPLCLKVSSEIAENGTTYRLAGVSTFGEYVAMAEKTGIVELGGSAFTAWISLKAPWYNVRLS
jgi:NYN domain